MRSKYRDRSHLNDAGRKGCARGKSTDREPTRIGTKHLRRYKHDSKHERQPLDFSSTKRRAWYQCRKASRNHSMFCNSSATTIHHTHTQPHKPTILLPYLTVVAVGAAGKGRRADAKAPSPRPTPGALHGGGRRRALDGREQALGRNLCLGLAVCLIRGREPPAPRRLGHPNVRGERVGDGEGARRHHLGRSPQVWGATLT